MPRHPRPPANLQDRGGQSGAPQRQSGAPQRQSGAEQRQSTRDAELRERRSYLKNFWYAAGEALSRAEDLPLGLPEA